MFLAPGVQQHITGSRIQSTAIAIGFQNRNIGNAAYVGDDSIF